MKRTPIKQVNGPRRAKKLKRNFPHADKIRALPCAIAELHDKDQAGPSWHIRGLLDAGVPADVLACSGAIVSAHVKGARGMGGCNTDPDDPGQCPLCHHHHAQSGELGTTERAEFEQLYAIDLGEVADRHWAEIAGAA